MLKNPCCLAGIFSCRKEGNMDLLLKCAQEFERLLPYQYHITVGRKGQKLEFTISFDRADFHHLAGLHKLKDNIRFQTGKRSDIMLEILNGELTYNDALLKKEKLNMLTGETIIQYDRLTPKESPKKEENKGK